MTHDRPRPAQNPDGSPALQGSYDSHAVHGFGDPHRDGLPEELAGLLAEIVPPGGTFRHREHIHLAYLAARRHSTDRAADKVSG